MKDANEKTVLLLEDEPTHDVDKEAANGDGKDLSHDADEIRDVDRARETNMRLPESENETSSANRNESRQSKKSRFIGWLIVLVAVVVTVITGALLMRQRAEKKKTTDAPNADESAVSTIALSPEQRANVAVEIVGPRTLTFDVTAPGKIAFNGNRVTPVFSQFNGRLVKLNVEINQTVRAGAILGMIDTPDIISSQSDFQQALTNERTARTALDLARRTRERAERLAAAEAIPQRDLQQAQADESRAADDVQRARGAVEAARGKLLSAGMSAAEIEQLAAGGRAVNRTVPLVAPIGGTIIERKAGLGQIVQAGAGDPLMLIADLSTVWVNADVYEDQLSKVRIGASVRIQTPAYPNETFAARIDQIGSVVDPDKHTVSVRCVVANREGRLKPNMFANVIFNSATTQNALTVPVSAVVTEGAKRVVFVENGGTFEKREIETGGETEGAVIVKSGLKPGERVVVQGGLLVAGEAR
jgi:cobalt-zinc-cadmium efflux system membrane fusion protein